MDVHAYRTDGPWVLEAIELPAPADARGAPGAAHVLSIKHPDADGLRPWLEPLGVEVDEVMRRIEGFSRPRARPLGSDVGLLVWPARGDDGRRTPVAVVVTVGLLIFMRHEAVPGLDEWFAKAPHWRHPGGLCAPDVLCSYFDHILTRAMGEYVGLRDRTDELAHLAMDAPDELDPKDILHAKEAGARVSARTESIAFLVILLQAWDTLLPVLRTERPIFVTVEHGLRHLRQAIERLDERLEDVFRRHQVEQQDRTNRRLNVLTVVSAVFMPLTLIAGIYGMNFQGMPELVSPWGYPATLAVMAVVGMGMLALFWRKGWFR